MPLRTVLCVCIFAVLGQGCAQGGKGKRIERIGSREIVQVEDIPQTSDILLLVDSSDSMRSVGNTIRKALNRWVDTMETISSQENPGEIAFSYLVYLTSTHVSSDANTRIAGFNGNHAAFTNTLKENLGNFRNSLLTGFGIVFNPNFPVQTSLWNAMELSLQKFAEARKRTILNIVFFGDADGHDRSTREALARLIPQLKEIRTSRHFVNIWAFLRSPKSGKDYSNVGLDELVRDLKQPPINGQPQISGAERMVELLSANVAKGELFVINRDGSTQTDTQIENIMIQFGKGVSEPPTRYALRTIVTEDIIRVLINGNELPRQAYRLETPSTPEGRFFLELNAPPPPGSKLEIVYR